MTRMFLLIVILSSWLAAPSYAVTPAGPIHTYPAEYFSHWQPNNALDMLIRLPGISLQQDDDGQPLLQLHGMGNQYLAILVDGHPLTGNGSNNSRSARQIPASLIERVEVTRNGRSDLDSRGGAAGSINLILKSTDLKQQTVRLNLGGAPLNSAIATSGTMQLNNAQLNYAFDAQKLRQKISAKQSFSDNQMAGDHWNSLRSENSTSYYISYRNDSDNQQTYGISLLYLDNHEKERNFDRNSELTLQGLQSQQNRHQTGRLNGYIHGHWSHMRWQSYLFMEQFDEQQRSQQSGVKNKDQRWQIGASLEEVVDEHHWQAGFNLRYMKHRVESDTLPVSSAVALNYDVSENALHWFALDRWQLTHSTLFEAGFRMETYELKQSDRLSTKESETTGDTYWLPSVHLMHQYNDHVRLHASSSQSVRQPELELRIPYSIRDDDIELRGNGSLDAELVSSIDLSYEYQRNNRNKLNLSLFQRTINNAILQVSRTETQQGQTITVFEPQNSEVSGTLRGLELDTSQPLTDNLWYQLSVGLYRSYLRANDDRSSQRLAHQPEYSARFSVHAAPGRWRYGGLWHYQGISEQRLSGLAGSIEEQTNRIGHSLDLYLGYQWQRWQINFSGQHLLNDDWESRTGEEQLRYHRRPLWQLELKGHF